LFGAALFKCVLPALDTKFKPQIAALAKIVFLSRDLGK
jgi:hypothetical protein